MLSRRCSGRTGRPSGRCTTWTRSDAGFAGFRQHLGFGRFVFTFEDFSQHRPVLLRANKGKRREAQTQDTQHAAKELVGVEFAFHAHFVTLCGDFVAVAVDVFDDKAVLAGVDVEFKIIGAVGQNTVGRLQILVVVGITGLGLLHLFAYGEVGAVFLLNHVNGDVDGGLSRRVIGGHGQAHRDVKEVLAVNGQAPNQADVLLSGFAEVVVIGGKRHRKQGKPEQNGGHTKVEEDVPSCFLQALFALFDGHFFHQLVLVLVNGQCARCIKFLFGHKSPISAEHFKTATEESAHNGNRWNQERRHGQAHHGASLGRLESGAAPLQHAAHRRGGEKAQPRC